MIEKAIYELLTTDAGLSALVGARVYALGLPQNAVHPCVAYTVDRGTEDETFDGQGNFLQSEAQIDCWAKTYLETLAMADAVKAALKNTSGIYAGVNIQRMVLVSSVSVIEDAVDLYRTTQVYVFNA